MAVVQGCREISTLVSVELKAQVTSSGSAEREFCSCLVGGRSLPMHNPLLFLDQVLCVLCPWKSRKWQVMFASSACLGCSFMCWQHHQRHRTGCLISELSLSSALAQLPRRFTRENGCKCLSIPGPSRHPVVFGRELLATASQAATWSIGIRCWADVFYQKAQNAVRRTQGNLTGSL